MRLRSKCLEFIIYVSLIFFGCTDNKSPVSSESDPIVPTEDFLIKHLNQAYEDNSNGMLLLFFNIWESSIKPVKYVDRSHKSTAIEELYILYKEFFDPNNISSLYNRPNNEYKDSLYTNTFYYVIQDYMQCHVADSLYGLTYPYFNEIFQSDTISNFRPPLECPENIKFLYSHSNFITSIENFLDLDWDDVDDETHWKRYDFINQYLTIFNGHWGGYRIITAPRISKIIFNKDYRSATIYWRVLSNGGMAFWQKENNKWIQKESHFQWTY